MEYQNFDLTIDRAEGDYYKAHAKAPNGKEATSIFRLPFDDIEFHHFWQRLGVDSRGARREGSASRIEIPIPDLNAAEAFGDRLFNAIFDREVENCLRSSMDENDAPGKGLRIRLRLNSPELEGLPWEYLYDPRPRDHFFALSTRTPIVRFPELPEAIRPMPAPCPLRILVMIGSHEGLDVNRERDKMKKALSDLEREGVVELVFMEESTLWALHEQLSENEYHVFHFIGHGMFDQDVGEGRLLFDGPDRSSREITGKKLGALFYDHTSLRLAVLNACQGAVAAHDNAFSGVAQQLIQQRLPAVIAMQREITDNAAIAFANGFYRAVARGNQVEAALAESRRAVYAQPNDVEWGIPVLYSRADNGRLFEARPAGRAAPIINQQLVINLPPGEPYTISSYLRRPEAESQAFAYLSTHGRPVAIWGAARSGKTWLFRYLLEHLSQDQKQCRDHQGLCGEPCEIILFDLNWIDRDARSDFDLLVRELARQIAKPVAKAVGEDAENWVSIAWREAETPNQKIRWLLEEKVLPQLKGTLILAIDQADIIWEWDCQDEFFYLLRVMAGTGTYEKLWSPLRLLLTVSTTPYLLTKDIDNSPFNLSDPIRLQDFDAEQVATLARLHHLNWTADTDIPGLMAWVGGHPYLIRLAMYKGARHGVLPQDLIEERNLHNDIFSGHLRKTLRWLQANDLTEAIKSVLYSPSKRLEDRRQEELLRRSGLVDRESGSYRLRYKLYESYLKSEL